MKKYKLKKDFPGSKIGDVWVKDSDGFMSPEDSPLKMHEQLFEPFDEWFEEEPKGKALYWMILTLKNFIENEPDDKWVDLEDCKQMLEKLNAWQRLKDKGFRFKDWEVKNGHKIFFGLDDTSFNAGWLDEDIVIDLDLLFGGEE